MAYDKEAVDFLKKWERFVPYSYDDKSKQNIPYTSQDGAHYGIPPRYTGEQRLRGTETAGYGRTAGVKTGGRVNEPDESRWMTNRMDRDQSQLMPAIRAPFSQHMLNALLAQSYNSGVGGVKRSHLLKDLNRGDYEKAANQFDWIHSGGKVVDGLIDRENETKDMFRKGMPEFMTKTALGKTAKPELDRDYLMQLLHGE